MADVGWKSSFQFALVKKSYVSKTLMSRGCFIISETRCTIFIATCCQLSMMGQQILRQA